MRITSIILLFILCLSGCSTNNIPPSTYDPESLARASSFLIEIEEPIKEFSIDFDRRALGGMGIAGPLESIVPDESKVEARMVMESLQSDATLRSIEAFIVSDLCTIIDGKCADGPTDYTIKIVPRYVGYRFDQMHNTKYVPSYIAHVTITKGEDILFSHTIGSGNLDRMGTMRRVGARVDLGFSKPESILKDISESVGNLEEAISDVNQAIAAYIKNQK